MRLITIILYLLLMIIGVSFAVLNASMIDLNLYIIKFSLPLPLLLTLVLGLGLIIGFFLGLYKYWRLKFSFNKIKNQLKLTEQEIKNLREIPLKNQH